MISRNTTGISNLCDDLSEGTVMDGLGHSALHIEGEGTCEKRPQSQVMVDILPDNVLLEIFTFCKEDHICHFGLTWRWMTLIHVCRRWRHIIFGSPRRLDLRLVCYPSTPTRRLLDIWPPFPIDLSVIDPILGDEQLENIMAVLERRDRTSVIYIYDYMNTSALERLMTAMHDPFPVLTRFSIYSPSNSVSMPVLPETFLGGSAPHLVSFSLQAFPFPTFPKFILSSTQIESLCLSDIRHSGYISPESMATCLAALPNLDILRIGFRSPLSRPVQIGPPPMKRAVLPALTNHHFNGVSEYFEDFVARIDTPQLESLTVTFFMDLVFDLSQLRNFIGLRQEATQAFMEFGTGLIKIVLWSQSHFELGIKCERLDRQLSSMTQIFSQQLPLLSHVSYFELRESRFLIACPDMDPSQWLELFRLLISVESLFVSEGLVNSVTASLKDLTGAMAMETLPALRNLSLEGHRPSGPVQDAIKSFVTARQLTNHPVLVQPWER